MGDERSDNSTGLSGSRSWPTAFLPVSMFNVDRVPVTFLPVWCGLMARDGRQGAYLDWSSKNAIGLYPIDRTNALLAGFPQRSA